MTWQDEMRALQSAGKTKPGDVVEYAADPATALHSRFTWDDSVAGHRHRLWQARQLIRAWVTVEASSGIEHRVYVSLESDRKKPGGGYRVTADVLQDDALRAELLAQALRELQRWEDRYKQLTELAGVFATARKARKRAKPKRRKTGT